MEESLKAYANAPRDGVALLLAERLAKAGVQPFSAIKILLAGRSIRVFKQTADAISSALRAPLRARGALRRPQF